VDKVGTFSEIQMYCSLDYKGTLSTVQNAQATALNEMQEITEATAGLNFPSGRPAKFQSALSVAAPFLNQQQAAQFGLVKGEGQCLPYG
jgi:hypothetical protein